VAVVLLGGGAAALFALKADGSKPAAAPEVAESTQPATEVASPTPTAKEPAAPPPSPAPQPAPPAPPAAEPVEPATIAIAINIDNAEVTVDGKHVDVTGKSARVTVDEAGAHVVAVKAHGREPFEQTVETKPGEVAQVVAKLERLKQKPATTAAKPTIKTQPSQRAGSGSATKPKPTFVDKNAPINPF
jgi:hypothetical protein